MSVTLKLHFGAFNALRKDPAVVAELQRRARAIAEAAGEGVEVEDPYLGRSRARVTVRTATNAARRAEAKDRALSSALDAGRAS